MVGTAMAIPATNTRLATISPHSVADNNPSNNNPRAATIKLMQAMVHMGHAGRDASNNQCHAHARQAREP